jgi:hypothetical protein
LRRGRAGRKSGSNSSSIQATPTLPFIEIEIATIVRKPGRNVVLFTLDLDRELHAQLEDVPKKAQRERREKGGQLIEAKHDVMNWPLYLRVLDARKQGASSREIAAILPKKMR